MPTEALLAVLLGALLHAGWNAAIKSGIDNNVIAPLVAEGKITQYEASPEYQGSSFIPIADSVASQRVITRCSSGNAAGHWFGPSRRK